ncbi:MAG: hypothetical protein AB7D27_12235 [Desulfomicrobium sp.]
MLIKYLNKGRGDAQKAADYLIGDYDWTGEKRKEVSVLYGSPNLVAKVANSLINPNVYTSGVVAWAVTDKPTDQQILEAMYLWRILAFACLDIERFCHCEVLHRDFDGGVHVHMLIARVDLETGKCFNPAPPRWEQTFGTMQDLLNHQYGWADPNDPMRARILQPGPRVYVDKSRQREGFEFEPDSRGIIHDIVINGIKEGEVTNRSSMVGYVESFDYEVVRTGYNYISIKNPNGGYNIRLKGSLYLKDREFDRIIEEEWRTDADLVRYPDGRAANEAFERFEGVREKRSNYNMKRFAVKNKDYSNLTQEVIDSEWIANCSHNFLSKRSKDSYFGRADVYLSTLFYKYVEIHTIVKKNNKEEISVNNRSQISNRSKNNDLNNCCPDDFCCDVFEKYKENFKYFELYNCDYLEEFQAIMSKIIFYIYDTDIKNKILSDIIYDFYNVNSEYYINYINICNKYVENFEMSMSNENNFNACDDTPEFQSNRKNLLSGLKM